MPVNKETKSNHIQYIIDSKINAYLKITSDYSVSSKVKQLYEIKLSFTHIVSYPKRLLYGNVITPYYYCC